MRQIRLALAVLLLVGHATATYGPQEVEKLIKRRDPAIQAQIEKILDIGLKPGIDQHDVDLCREIQTLKKLKADQEVLVSQLAIFVAATPSIGETHVLILKDMLRLLDIPPRITIRVLAPYLDTDNHQLRDSVRLWFKFHDGGGSAPERAPPITPVNYEDHLRYVASKVTHKEEVPAPYVKYIFERSPGRALLIFAFASSQGDTTMRPQTPQDLGAFLEAKKAERREIELAEHIISNAIWLKENKFEERFQAALPEATTELEKLAKHKEWWARLYVAHIMRKHVELRRADVWESLGKDTDELVRKAAQ